MATVQIGRLTVRPASGGRLGGSASDSVVARLRAEALLRELDAVDIDRTVLVVRQLRWPIDELSAPAARRMVVDYRRRAVRPAHRRAVSPAADAVLFADEVELLCCLTRDAVSGRLGQWYWQRLLPRSAAGAGSVGGQLATAWVERARWLPKALAALEVHLARDAVSMLSNPQAEQVLSALRWEFDLTGPSPRARRYPPSPAVRPREGGPPEAPRFPAPSRPDLPAFPAAPRRDRPAGRPPPFAQALPGAATFGAGRPQLAVLGVALMLAHRPGQALHPDFAAALEEWLAEEWPDGHPPLPTDSGSRSRAEAPAAGLPALTPPAGWAAPEPMATADECEAARADDGPVESVSASEAAWPEALPSAFASVLYLVNLLPELDLDDAQESGWAVIEAIARTVLTEEQAPEDDAMWLLLATADGRAPAEALPVPPAGHYWSAQVLGWLAERDVELAVLARPGLISASATHIDVVFGIEQIDLSARICGLDRDPGWVPALGRIIAFHFQGGG